MQQTFSDLKTKIDNLLKETSHKKIVLILQDIMYTLLSGYCNNQRKKSEKTKNTPQKRIAHYVRILT